MDAWLEQLGDDPLAVLARWLAEARDAGLFEPEAVTLATSTPDGRPSARMVLVRGVDEGDLRFYTNHQSRKAGELAANPRAALVFHWGPPLRRQARVEGTVARLSDAESVAYFTTRARESRLGAWASPQSRPLADRAELDRLLTEAEKRFGADDDVGLPLSGAVTASFPMRSSFGRTGRTDSTTVHGSTARKTPGRASGSRPSAVLRQEGGASALFV